jgi:hypothetical protein
MKLRQILEYAHAWSNSMKNASWPANREWIKRELALEAMIKKEKRHEIRLSDSASSASSAVKPSRSSRRPKI